MVSSSSIEVDQEKQMELNNDGLVGLVLEEEEEDTMGLDKDFQWCLVDRVLADKMINFQAMRNTIAMLWRPLQGVCIKELSDNGEREEQRYLFQFFHGVDVKRIENGGPWTFNNYHILLHRLKEKENPHKVELKWTNFLIQVYHLPIGFWREKVAKSIGNYVGEYLESDLNNFHGTWREYIRLRVRVDSAKPLLANMKIKKVGGEWSAIDFKYERLSIFYFICGHIGHLDRFCRKVLENPDVERLLSKDIRAALKRTMAGSAGERWLRDGRSSKSGQVWRNPLEFESSVIQGTVKEVARSKEQGRKDYRGGGGENIGSNSNSNPVDISLSNLNDTSNKEGIIIHDDKRRKREAGEDHKKKNVDQKMGLATSEAQTGNETQCYLVHDPKNLKEASLGRDQACKQR
ncbi:conserved hypothetical protein [Ricinus communis]|uniref:DUF4283 domain-containing protein n=1 Tax=Ricinus communis TaxID=3988 RepID=B9T497_RICCO|nr:conserved hypothetical protein [Ricinus communis]|eukprot:XP_002533066.1 uncharacterized protein LOC8266771 [Ricinus communis]